MSTPWSSVERPGSTQHQSGRRSEPSEAHGGLDRLDAKLRMRGWCQGRLCRRAAVDRPLTPASQPNTTIQAIKTDTHDPARHLMVATRLGKLRDRPEYALKEFAGSRISRGKS